MTPLRLSYTWHRRFYVAIFLLAAALLTVFLLQEFSSVVIPDNLYVSLPVAIGLGLAVIGSIAGFLLAKKYTSFLPNLIVFAIFGLSVAWFVKQTGGTASPLLILWALVAFSAAIFGAYGWVGIFGITAAYVAGAYLANDLTVETITVILFSSILPLTAGIIVWRDHKENEEERSVKNLANQLSEVANKSEIVINAIGDGVVAIDSKGTIQLINPAAQEILGWGKQDALMLSYKSILKLTDLNGTELDLTVDPIQQVLNTNQQTRSNKLLALTQAGKKISLALVVSPIGDAGSGVIVVFRDTTKERAEEREQAEFISTASHEMRTPVAAIEGYMGLALNPNTAQIDARARDFIMKAHEAAQHLGRLFQDLLDVSKSEDGRMTSIPKVVDIVTYTETIVQGLAQKAQEKGLQLNFKPNENSTSSQRKIMPVYFINQDNDHVREILDNLIENAIKYTPSGMVEVDVSGTDDKVVVSIKDSGLGIPTEDVSHLFQKFYRVDNIDRQSIGGTGLGLYLSRRLAEAMQGRLWVESEFGKGSTFFFELPRIDSQKATELKQQQEAAVQQAAQRAATPAPITPVNPVPVVVPVALAPTLNPAPAAAPVPVMPVAVPTPDSTSIPVTMAPQATPATPPPIGIAPTPQAAPAPAGVRPATTVPRGESLSREQINERVKQLEALSQQQREGTSR